MGVCARCGKPDHAPSACPGPSLAPPAHPSSMPPPSLTGAHATANNPASRALVLLKTQLNLAVSQREEDPERAWLELVSVRERLRGVTADATEDALLAADAARFRAKLEEQIAKLTSDVGDEVIAPLYSWVDLLRQRERLERDVESARRRVSEARRSRGAPLADAPTRDDEAATAIAAAERDLARCRAEAADPGAEARALWEAAGGEAMRDALPKDLETVRARAVAARAVIERARGRPLGLSTYAGSKAEMLIVPACGAIGLCATLLALASSPGGASGALAALAATAWVAFGAAVFAGVRARRRRDAERGAAFDTVYNHLFCREQAEGLDLELGWLRALSAALRARRAFDEHKGEGGQLSELSSWRPDLEEMIAEVARSAERTG